ncbi:hypothetical protein ACFXGI_34615 [Streptomyces sp. NPDC059355]|uniref:hypothetical protein n=1 Tax=Streptomyces sp. NPDC059355 TaxID=3346811 RepID=UPI003690961E
MAVNIPPTTGPTKTEKVMAIIIAILSAIIAAFVAYMLTRHVGGTALVGVCSSGASFTAALGIVAYIEKELGLLRPTHTRNTRHPAALGPFEGYRAPLSFSAPGQAPLGPPGG